MASSAPRDWADPVYKALGKLGRAVEIVRCYYFTKKATRGLCPAPVGSVKPFR